MPIKATDPNSSTNSTAQRRICNMRRLKRNMFTRGTAAASAITIPIYMVDCDISPPLSEKARSVYSSVPAAK